MNSYAGTLRFEKGLEKFHHDKNYFKKLAADFPSSFSTSLSQFYFPLSYCGDFQVTSIEQHQLFFLGEIFNQNEIASLNKASLSSFHNKADLVLSLILKMGLQEVKKINGQFIIIYISRTQQKLFILNDHLGIQQIFYYQTSGIFLFANEIKFLLAHSESTKGIDWETSLKRPLGFSALHPFRSYKTWFKDICLLPESTILEIDLLTGNTKSKKYWCSLTGSDPGHAIDKRNARQVMEEYMDVLEDAVKIRIEDNETGYSLLSGGLDSSALCALAARHKPLETFSIITQTTYLEETTNICNRLSKDLMFRNAQFLIPVHEISFNKELWKQRIWRTESPFNHTDSLTKTLLHHSISRKYPEVKYVLTGTGSDQLNGGLARWVVNDRKTEEESFGAFFSEIIDTENQTLISRADDSLWKMRKFINREFLSSISGHTIEKNPWLFYVNSALHDQMFTLLWDEVRASSAYGRVTRFPFLDYRIAEFIAAVPPRLYKELFYDKQILRVLSKKILPQYIVSKHKAPALFEDYDFRFNLFNFLTRENSLLVEALGNLDQDHPVINKRSLLNRIDHLKQEPDIMEWQYIMHIINLGLLEKLPGKSETDLSFEATIDEPPEVAFNDPTKTKVFLESRLSIKSMEDYTCFPLQFENGCSLLFDKLNNKYFLSRKNSLVFEIEDQHDDWKNFLLHVDNSKSTRQILAEQHIEYEKIKEFLQLSLEEKILITVKIEV